MAEYIERKKAIKELGNAYEYEYPTANGAFDEFATTIVPNILKNIPAANVADVEEVIKSINFSINATDGKTDYDIGLKNGLKLALSFIDGKEPNFENCGNLRGAENES